MMFISWFMDQPIHGIMLCVLMIQVYLVVSNYRTRRLVKSLELRYDGVVDRLIEVRSHLKRQIEESLH